MLDWRNFHLAVIFLDMRCCTLQFSENIVVSTHTILSTIQSLIIQFEPSRVFLSSRISSKIVEEVADLSLQHGFIFDMRPSLEFNPEILPELLIQLEEKLDNGSENTISRLIMFLTQFSNMLLTVWYTQNYLDVIDTNTRF